MKAFLSQKSYRVIVWYSEEAVLRAKLKALDVEFTERPIHSEFYGTEFSIYKPRGKGATEKMRAIDKL